MKRYNPATRPLYPNVKTRIKRYAELICNGLEVEIKSSTITILKSMLLLRIMWNVVLLNQYRDDDHPREAFGLYFSLDDTNEELMPRIVAMDQGVTINQVLFPKAVSEPVVLEKRDAGLDRLKANVQHFAMRDADDGTTIEYIEETIEEYTNQLETLYPGRFQLVVFVDNFHDIDVAREGYSEDIVRFDYVASHLTDIANKYLIPIMCSAEFRKISAHKRPSEDDIKSSGLKDRPSVVILIEHSFNCGELLTA